MQKAKQEAEALAEIARKKQEEEAELQRQWNAIMAQRAEQEKKDKEEYQTISVWDWPSDNEGPICTAAVGTQDMWTSRMIQGNKQCENSIYDQDA